MKHYKTTAQLALVFAIIALISGLANECCGQIKNIKLTDHAAWFSGDTAIITSHHIVKVDCKGYGNTNIDWKSQQELSDELTKQANNEMWTEADKKGIKVTVDASKGGEIMAYIARTSIEWANTENFTVIIKDKAGVEILRKKLKNDVPEVPIKGDYWWNITTITIPKKLDFPFDVFLIDAGSSIPKCQFRVIN